jgi:hypothetical protein
VQREGERVRLFTRNGHDWSDRLPRIVRGRSAQSHVVVRARRPAVLLGSDFEQGEIGPDLCRHACLPGPGGLVPKHRESLYRSIRFAPDHPAFARMMERFWG